MSKIKIFRNNHLYVPRQSRIFLWDNFSIKILVDRNSHEFQCGLVYTNDQYSASPKLLVSCFPSRTKSTNPYFLKFHSMKTSSITFRATRRLLDRNSGRMQQVLLFSRFYFKLLENHELQFVHQSPSQRFSTSDKLINCPFLPFDPLNWNLMGRKSFSMLTYSVCLNNQTQLFPKQLSVLSSTNISLNKFLVEQHHSRILFRVFPFVKKLRSRNSHKLQGCLIFTADQYWLPQNDWFHFSIKNVMHKSLLAESFQNQVVLLRCSHGNI